MRTLGKIMKKYRAGNSRKMVKICGFHNKRGVVAETLGD